MDFRIAVSALVRRPRVLFRAGLRVLTQLALVVLCIVLAPLSGCVGAEYNRTGTHAESVEKGVLASRGLTEDPDQKLAADEAHPAASPTGRYELRVMHDSKSRLSFEIWTRGTGGDPKLVYRSDRSLSGMHTTVFAWDDLERVWVYSGDLGLYTWAQSAGQNWSQIPSDVNHGPIPGLIKRFRPRLGLDLRRGPAGHDYPKTVKEPTLSFLMRPLSTAEPPAARRSLLARFADGRLIPEDVHVFAEGFGEDQQVFVSDPKTGKREEIGTYVQQLVAKAKLAKPAGRPSPEQFITLVRLVDILQILDKRSDATELLSQLEATANEDGPVDSHFPGAIDSLWSAAKLTENARLYEQAEHLYRRVDQLLAKAVHRDSLYRASVLDDIARCCEAQANFAEATKLYGDSLSIRAWVLTENHPETAASMRNLAVASSKAGYLDSAAELFRKASTTLEENNFIETLDGIDKLQIAELHSEYADTLNRLGRPQAAEAQESRAQEIRSRLEAQRAVVQRSSRFPAW